MKIIEVKCSNWILPKWVGEIVLYPYIFYNVNHLRWNDLEWREELREHAWFHVGDMRKVGVLFWYIRRCWRSLKTNYMDLPSEVEAYKHQGDGTKPWETEFLR